MHGAMASKKTTSSAQPVKAPKLKAQEPPAVLAESEEPPAYTLPKLVARFFEATEADVLPYVASIAKTDLTERGRRVATSRIDKDCGRLYGIAADFADRATEAELDAMPAFSKRLLGVAIWAAYQGSGKAEQREASASKAGSDKKARQVDAAQLRTQGLLQRDQIAAALRPLAGGDEKLLKKINEAAYGAAASAKELSGVLLTLTGVGRTMLQDKSDAMKKRLEGTRVGDGLFNSLEALAGKIREAGDVAAAPLTATPIAQADVDYWDGINLYLLESLIDMFEAGNAQVPTIPRLVPISLRNLLSSRSGAKTPPTPAPPA
jgi:hypothetical protein